MPAIGRRSLFRSGQSQINHCDFCWKPQQFAMTPGQDNRGRVGPTSERRRWKKMRMARLKNRPAKRIYRSQRICKGPIKGSLFCRVLVNNTHHTNMTGPSFKLFVHRAITKKLGLARRRGSSELGCARIITFSRARRPDVPCLRPKRCAPPAN